MRYREHNKMRYREQNNKNNRTIGIGKYLRQYLTTMGNRVRLGYFRFSGFSGVARKLVKVSKIAEMPREIAWEASGSCSGSPGKSREVLGSLGKGMEHF